MNVLCPGFYISMICIIMWRSVQPGGGRHWRRW